MSETRLAGIGFARTVTGRETALCAPGTETYERRAASTETT